jgi:hypothetical protein
VEPEDFYKKIQFILEMDKKTREKMGNAGKASVVEKFSMETFTQHLEMELESLVESSPNYLLSFSNSFLVLLIFIVIIIVIWTK